ncbi:MAG: hypothetical protein IJV15_07445 [Lachnospiraceae bacterium]|nr:hypothetical protein [Lachnospiraceae bacterium]
MKKKKNKNSNLDNFKFVFVAILLVTVVLIYFNHVGNLSSEKKKAANKTELEELVSYDMYGNYPKTPRDVVKLHCRYFKMLYGDKGITDDDLVLLNQQIRNLYASELLLINGENDNLVSLKRNIEKMKEDGYTYQVYELPEASQVKYYTKDGKDMAALEITLTINTSDGKAYMYVLYVLKKEDDKWKIYAWGAPSTSSSTISGQ